MQIRKRGPALAIVAAAALFLTLFLLGATSGGAAASKTTAVSCNQTVTGTVTLTADLTGCGADGLIVGANGTVINLNGHEISGSSGQYGVLNPNYNSVTIMNGKIDGFSRGVEIEGGTLTTVKAMRITGNSTTGITTFDPAVITGNVVYSNGAAGISIGCCVSDKSQVTNNIVTGNTGNGINVSFTAAGSTVSGNRALSNTGNGINVQAPNVLVTSNIANANGGNGFVLTSSDTLPSLRASKNTANDNTQLGISFGPSDTDAGGNKAAGNGSQHQCDNIVCS